MSKCYNSPILYGDSWLAAGPWFGLASRDTMDGKRGSFSWFATTLGGLLSFWKVTKVFTAPTCVQTNLERLHPGGGEVNGNLSCSPSLPKIQINVGLKQAATSLRLCENCSDHYLETEHIKKFRMALDSLRNVLVESSVGHETGHSDPVRRCRCVCGCRSFALLFINLDNSRRPVGRAVANDSVLLMKWLSGSPTVEISKWSSFS